MLDWIIQGGQIIDGTGAPPYDADIGGERDYITVIGNLQNTAARAKFDAAGGCVCPGFIDAHSHSDAFLLVEPSAQSKIYQGVTTEVIGNCGASAAPIENLAQLPFDWQKLSYPDKWQSMAEYLRLLAECRPAVNVVPLVGHNKIRIAVMGYEARRPASDEMRKMERLLEKSLDEGAWGLSTGLIYRPGKYSSPLEIEKLAGIVARRNGIYTTHIRNESNQVREAIAETLDIGKKSDVRLQISHLKTAGAKNWQFIDEIIALLEKARDQGVVVAADRYPYTFSCTDLDIILPDWLTGVDRENILKHIRKDDVRRKLIKELSADRSENYWNDIIVATSSVAAWRGKPVSAVARDLRMEPAEAVLKILETDRLLTQAFYAGMSEENMWKIYSLPYVMVGSDAAFRVPHGLFADDHPHPRAYGSFTKFLRAALDGKTVSLPEAIRKMTSLAADHFQIKQRGILKPGNMADIIVFAPDKVRGLSTYENPHQLSEGIQLVMINGVVALECKVLTGNRSGRVLKPE